MDSTGKGPDKSYEDYTFRIAICNVLYIYKDLREVKFKMATGGSGQRNMGVRNEEGQGSQTVVEPRSKEQLQKLFLELLKAINITQTRILPLVVSKYRTKNKNVFQGM